ncbi:MAG: hypothetical protein QM743_00670 [Chitinophagaceae bacterium]
MIANTFGDNGIGYQRNDNPIFHPIEKLMQFHEEKMALYERMLHEKEAMLIVLQDLLKNNIRPIIPPGDPIL